MTDGTEVGVDFGVDFRSRLSTPISDCVIGITLRQRPIVCSCRHARSGRFRRRWGDLMPVR